MPVSDQECAASATIAADPVTTAATDFATASSPLATSATTTVSSDDPVPTLVDGRATLVGTRDRSGTTIFVKATFVWLFVGVFVLLGGQLSEAGTGNHSQEVSRSSSHARSRTTAARAAVIDRYVALGDSYTSGAGIPPAAASGCFRSARNYPHRVADRLSATGAQVALADVSCGLANTANAESAQTTFANNPPQLAEVNARTDLVTVSLGVNDAGFASLMTQCPALAPHNPSGAPCRASFQTTIGDLLFASVLGTRDKLARVLDLARSRAPRAQVMLIGYPQLVPDSGTCEELPFAEGDYAYARQFFVVLDAVMRSAARRAGATYVDVLSASDGHDICAGDDAWVQGAGQSGRSAPYHPFASEQRAVAAMVVDALK